MRCWPPRFRTRLTVAAIRVMLGELPAIQRGILEHTFAGQSDMMLVGINNADSPLSARVAANRPDVLIVGVERDEWATGFIELFIERPRLHILAIGGDARAATLQELYVRRQRIADLSPDAIVAAVRASRDTDSTSSAAAFGTSP